MFTYSHDIYGNVKIKSELHLIHIFENTSNGEKIDIQRPASGLL